MKTSTFAGILACLVTPVLLAQVVLSPTPGRIVGHPQLALKTGQPNTVEGRELNTPQDVAVDAERDILYVADTGNNRVMAWRNASTVSGPAYADLIIGQRDYFSSLNLGPGSDLSTGLTSPTAVAVDREGNLYIIDAGNNRILRFPRPFEQASDLKQPDLVLGQPNFNSRTANNGGVSDRSLAFAVGDNLYRSDLVFDLQGNLYVSDAGNNRVLRYAAAELRSGNNNAAANLVLGQAIFSTRDAQPNGQTNGVDNRVAVKDRMRAPSGMALDDDGRLYVADGVMPATNNPQTRVLVFEPPFVNGKAASAVMGVPVPAQGQTFVNQYNFFGAEGVFLIGNTPFVLDTNGSRLLRYPTYVNWTPGVSPGALAVMGQSMNTPGPLFPNAGSATASPTSFASPVRAAVAGGNVYVVDSGNNRILVFPNLALGNSPATRVIGQYEFQYRAPNLLDERGMSFPAGVTVDRRSDPPRLYVADRNNHRVLGYADARRLQPNAPADIVLGQANFLSAIPNFPSGNADLPTETGLASPSAVAVDNDGNLWVADTGNGRVLRFPKPFDRAGQQQRPDIVIGQAGFNLKIQDATRSTMSAPVGLAFTNEGHLLVSDAQHNRVLYFDKDQLTNGAAAQKVFGQGDFFSSASGAERNRMNSPRHIAVDIDDRLYVADSGNNRVLLFDRVPVSPEANVDSAVSLENTTTTTRLRTPVGVAVYRDTGEIWVTDANNRLLRYPSFLQLLTNPNAFAETSLAATGPISASFDTFGNLLVGEGTNRVAIYYQASKLVNGANFGQARANDVGPGQRVVPGMIASIFRLGQPFTSQTVSFDSLPNPVPLPRVLADTQVLLNNEPVPLDFVSPEQINFLVPMNAPESGEVQVQVVRQSTGQVLAVGCTAQFASNRYSCAGPLQADVASPGLFTRNANGIGQIAALNEDNSINSPENRISRGRVIQVFGTGQGRVPNAPPDGEVARGETRTTGEIQVLIGTRFVDPADIQYSGLAPDLIGVWQINVRIPEWVAPSDAVDFVVLYRSRLSNLQNGTVLKTTIAVRQ